MSKHKHYEMIVAKAANMDLVTLMKIGDEYPAKERPDYDWRSTKNCMPIAEDREYFLCLPQHKEACLHWLNGGDVQYSSEHSDGFVNWTPNETWGGGIVFMSEAYETRIKPKKVKRWIGVYDEGKTTDAYDSDIGVKTFMTLIGVSKYQVIDIEVEE